MTEVALLNPAQDAEACKAMMSVGRKRREALSAALTSSVLDRETYLQKIGALNELDRFLSDMQREHDRRFAV